jgi:hypothetical protein
MNKTLIAPEQVQVDAPLDTSRAAFELWASGVASFNPSDPLPIEGAMWGSDWLYDDERTRAAYAMWRYLHSAYKPRVSRRAVGGGLQVPEAFGIEYERELADVYVKRADAERELDRRNEKYGNGDGSRRIVPLARIAALPAAVEAAQQKEMQIQDSVHLIANEAKDVQAQPLPSDASGVQNTGGTSHE